jgi:hypothetical protein
MGATGFKLLGGKGIGGMTAGFFGGEMGAATGTVGDEAGANGDCGEELVGAVGAVGAGAATGAVGNEAGANGDCGEELVGAVGTVGAVLYLLQHRGTSRPRLIKRRQIFLPRLILQKKAIDVLQASNKVKNTSVAP